MQETLPNSFYETRITLIPNQTSTAQKGKTIDGYAHKYRCKYSQQIKFLQYTKKN